MKTSEKYQGSENLRGQSPGKKGSKGPPRRRGQVNAPSFQFGFPKGTGGHLSRRGELILAKTKARPPICSVPDWVRYTATSDYLQEAKANLFWKTVKARASSYLQFFIYKIR